MRFLIREIKVACPHCGESCDIGPELVTLVSARVVPEPPANPFAPAKALSTTPKQRAYQRAYYRKHKAMKKTAKVKAK